MRPYLCIVLLTLCVGTSILAADEHNNAAVPGNELPFVSPIHYRPRVGSLGDTNPFYWKGEYHIFYLHGVDHVPWEHIVSKDLVHWKELPTALVADGAADSADGMWMFTGCVIEKDGQFHIFYTGCNPSNPKGTQFVMHATSADLIRWTKHPEDIFGPDGELYANSRERDFRDPCVFWNEEAQEYWMVLCAGDRKTGRQGLAISKDLATWKLAPPLNAQNQECPDLFKIGDTWYLLNADTYAYSKTLHGEFKTPPVQNVIDRPCVYAGKQMFDGRRHVWTGWISDSDNGRDVGGFFNRLTWGGTQCSPRELYAGPEGQLYQRPVDEVTAMFSKPIMRLADQPAITRLHGSWAYEGAALIGQSGDISAACAVPSPDHYMLECSVLLDPQATLTITMRQQPNGVDGYNFVLRPKCQEAELGSPGLPGFRYTRRCTLDTDKPIKFQAFVQGTIIECFVNDQFAYSCRAYNYPKGTLGLKVEDGKAKVLQLAVKTYEEDVRLSSSPRPSDGRGAGDEGGRNCQKAIILSP